MASESDVADEDTCWQCGAPADPGCASEIKLVAAARMKADGFGYPVERGWFGDTVRVSVPRCEACQTRHRWQVLVVTIAAACGAAIGLMIDRGFASFFLGLWLGAGLASLPFLCRRMWEGLRSPQTYPPLARLRKAGWREPD